MNGAVPTSSPHSPPRLPAGVWVLGLVSLLMDVSSEMIHSLLPLLLVGSLGVSTFALGLIEGVAEAIALVAKVFSGALSDRLRRRKGLVVLGYAMGAASKPVFALAAGVGWVAGARFFDRVGKGIRGAPRDALLADIAPASMRGAAFGLRQSLDTVGAFAGPLLAAMLIGIWHFELRAVFWVAVVPAVLAVLLLGFGLREPEHRSGPKPAVRLDRAALAALGGDYWRVVAVASLFTLARFSEAFLVLRAQDCGVGLAWVPLVMVGMNGVYALVAYPAGGWSDRIGSRGLLMAGMLSLIVADLVLARADGWPWLLAGIALWGLHMGLTQGLFAAQIAKTAPAALRGTAFGLFNLCAGIATLLASAVAGLLWQTAGAAVTFIAGAGFAASGLLVLAWVREDTAERAP